MATSVKRNGQTDTATPDRPELIDVDGREVRIIESYDDAGAVYTPMPLPGLVPMGTEAIQVPAGLEGPERQAFIDAAADAIREQRRVDKAFLIPVGAVVEAPKENGDYTTGVVVERCKAGPFVAFPNGDVVGSRWKFIELTADDAGCVRVVDPDAWLAQQDAEGE